MACEGFPNRPLLLPGVLMKPLLRFANGWRFVPPLLLLAALLTMPFSWVEVCQVRQTEDGPEKEILVTQSGPQALWGGFSKSGTKNVDEILRADTWNDGWWASEEPSLEADKKDKKKDKKDQNQAAALFLWLFLAGSLGGIWFGFAVRLGRKRLVALCTSCWVAAAALGTQVAFGFPAAGPQRPSSNVSPNKLVGNRTTWPLAALLLTVGSLGAVGIEAHLLQRLEGVEEKAGVSIA